MAGDTMASKDLLDIRGLIKQEYGEQVLESCRVSMKEQRASSLRINTLLSDENEVISFMEEKGISLGRPEWTSEGLYFDASCENVIRSSDLYAEGKIYFQSLSSMMPVIIMDPKEGESILDMCAAPGGKTCQIAAVTANKAQITACEQQFKRAERLKYNLSKQGVKCAFVMNTDARKLDDLFRFDRILLDAPCSGTGTFTSEEEFDKHRKDFFEKLLDTQRKLMDKALKLLKPGGILVYSTCSILKEENEDNVARALKKSDIELLPIDTKRFGDVPLLPCSIEGTLTLCPDSRYEGFFIATLRKKI
ncbi:MAG: RsmB/NOP family class I SAM-dependent RNA methyltransferase [Clostridia bacterium]|nr:RsmB/NOP family class I SAM-dependent RNA methyltransferase [Clostridia bacterium]